MHVVVGGELALTALGEKTEKLSLVVVALMVLSRLPERSGTNSLLLGWEGSVVMLLAFLWTRPVYTESRSGSRPPTIP